MNNCNKLKTTTSILWAAAILAAAIMDAPVFMTLILLPVLGYTSVMAVSRQA